MASSIYDSDSLIYPEIEEYQMKYLLSNSAAAINFCILSSKFLNTNFLRFVPFAVWDPQMVRIHSTSISFL